MAPIDDPPIQFVKYWSNIRHDGSIRFPYPCKKWVLDRITTPRDPRVWIVANLDSLKVLSYVFLDRNPKRTGFSYPFTVPFTFSTIFYGSWLWGSDKPLQKYSSQWDSLICSISICWGFDVLFLSLYRSLLLPWFFDLFTHALSYCPVRKTGQGLSYRCCFQRNRPRWLE